MTAPTMVRAWSIDLVLVLGLGLGYLRRVVVDLFARPRMHIACGRDRHISLAVHYNGLDDHLSVQYSIKSDLTGRY